MGIALFAITFFVSNLLVLNFGTNLITKESPAIKVMPTFHPAYLLRDPRKKRDVWEDMKKVRDFLQH